MTTNWTCSNCGCVHWDELKPISCIMCNNDTFVDRPDKFYSTKKILNQKETDDDKD